MSFTKKVTVGVILAAVIAQMIGCSKEYEIWLYNFSGTRIAVDHRGSETKIDNGESALLYDDNRKENLLFPTVLTVDFGDGVSCYPLENIKVGGYGEFDESGVLRVRLKLGSDRKVYVYKVSKGRFQPSGIAGEQPLGYPTLPAEC